MAIGKIPDWAKSFITEAEAKKVAASIQRVEKNTSVEIVTMIVQRSSSLGHVPFQVTMLLLIGILVFEVPQIEFFAAMNLTWLFLVFGLLCYGLGVLLAKFSWVQRVLVPSSDQQFQVDERAHLEFYLSGINSTQGKTGVLIFVSLLERRAVILADKSVADKLPPETWSCFVNELVNSLKVGQVSEGLITAVLGVGSTVTPLFPVRRDDKNELANHLIIKQ